MKLFFNFWEMPRWESFSALGIKQETCRLHPRISQGCRHWTITLLPPLPGLRSGDAALVPCVPGSELSNKNKNRRLGFKAKILNFKRGKQISSLLTNTLLGVNEFHANRNQKATGYQFYRHFHSRF